jgi:phage shock protein C
MSRKSWNPDYGALQGMYRDRENGWIFGVCAGIAARFGFGVFAVRLVAVLGLILLFWPTVLVYIGATLLIREKPLIYSGKDREYEFWRRDARRDHWSHS